MFFIGGAGNGSKDLGRRTNQVCPGCGSRLGMQLIRTNGYIHLFFVPVFRYDIQYFLICPNCGKTYEISREDGRRLERQPDFALPPDHLIPTGNRPIAQTRFCPSCGSETGPSDLPFVNHQSRPLGDGFFAACGSIQSGGHSSGTRLTRRPDRAGSGRRVTEHTPRPCQLRRL